MFGIAIATIRFFFATVFLFCSTIIDPAIAQVRGDGPDIYAATYSAPFSRYYAPYALQAAAAYKSVNDFDSTRRAENLPSIDGSDVRFALSNFAEPEIYTQATKYLRVWQYQFGHEGYVTCLYDDPDCKETIKRDTWKAEISGGPSFHVWARKPYPQRDGTACSEVSIAFRGSTISTADWISNFDPVSGYVADNHYRQLRRNINAIIKKIASLPCFRARTQIVSVGHSLGGGLGQLAGLGNHPSRPRINKVIAFDPSPVTGASYVEKGRLHANAAGLEIDRVYQSGEALERLRRWYEEFPKSSHPCVRTVTFGLLRPAGGRTLHDMDGLARELVRASYEDGTQRPFKLPKRLPNCGSRYVEPGSDGDQFQQQAPDQLIVSTRGPAGTRPARARQGRATAGPAVIAGFESDSFAQQTEQAAILLPERSARNGKRMARPAKHDQTAAPIANARIDATLPPG